MAKTTLGDIAQYINGRAFKPTEWEDTGLPIIRIQNLTNKNQDYNRTTQKYESKYLVNDGDLLFAWSASLGAHIWHGESGWLNQHIFKVIPNKGTDKLYLYYYLLHIVDVLYAKTHGSGMVHITLKPFKDTEIYLPPLRRQHCIVNCIKSLFAKLDEAKEKVQSALDSFETRKAAILHKAFTGELTAKWREENGLGIESWVNKSLGMCGTLERGRSRHRPRNAPELFNGPYPFIQTGDVASADVYITQHKQTLSEMGLEQSRIFPKGTLCITIAANIGDVAILSYDSCFPDSVVGFTPNYCTDSKFIYYMMSVLQKILKAEAPATAQKNINLKILNDVTFLCPDQPEQIEIVRILDSFFTKERKAKELCSILDKIDLIKKSILARTFRGELGTNDPTEESAMELLKSIV